MIAHWYQFSVLSSRCSIPLTLASSCYTDIMHKTDISRVR